MVSKAQAAATQKYQKKAYDRVYIRFRKDGHPNFDELQAAADKAGESINGYVTKAIQQRMERES